MTQAKAPKHSLFWCLLPRSDSKNEPCSCHLFYAILQCKNKFVCQNLDEPTGFLSSLNWSTFTTLGFHSAPFHGKVKKTQFWFWGLPPLWYLIGTKPSKPSKLVLKWRETASKNKFNHCTPSLRFGCDVVTNLPWPTFNSATENPNHELSEWPNKT